jgi:hypothetical protein
MAAADAEAVAVAVARLKRYKEILSVMRLLTA